MYSDDDFDYNDDSAADISDYDLVEDGGGGGSGSGGSINKKPYKILTEETRKQLQENDISEVSDVLSVSRWRACTLLIRNKWSVSSAMDEWLGEEEKVSITQPPPKKRRSYCKICMQNVNTNLMSSASCGHLFCMDCWTSYVAVSINEGPQCLVLRCPEFNCAAVVGLEMVEEVAADGDKDKFYRHLHGSYVDGSKNRKWCPGKGCNLAVQIEDGEEKSNIITCDCGHKFCWRCTEDLHRPLSCDMVAKWAKKNSSEEENSSWILVNTKPCPDCGKRIEKNQGCNHMTCTCKHEFCWFCLQKWENYNHACNKYQKDKEEARCSSLRARKNALQRYLHYYERYASNRKSLEIARADLVRCTNKHLPELSKVQTLTEKECLFVIEAWEQIIECRRMLKWSYVFGYYLEAKEKSELFGFLQGQAESALERLHHRAEKEMKKFLYPGKLPESFVDFRADLIDQTSVTRKYFENLMVALENDLAEVGSN